MTGPSPTFHLGTIRSWNPLTLENSVEVGEDLLANLPVFGSEAASLQAGDQVGIVITHKGWAILGRLVTPTSADPIGTEALARAALVKDLRESATIMTERCATEYRHVAGLLEDHEISVEQAHARLRAADIGWPT